MMRLAKLRLGGISPIQFQVDEYDRLVHLNSLVPDIRNFHVNTHQQSASTDISQSHAECGRYLLSVGSDSRINLFDLDLSLSRGPVESVDKYVTHLLVVNVNPLK
jgi:hypothetical protein